MGCEHKNFEAEVNTFRLTEEDGLVTSFKVELKVRCVDCKEHLEFLGMEMGVNPSYPTTGIDGIEARLPAKIKNEAKIIKMG